MVSRLEPQRRVWWHPGLGGWAWLCWRCRAAAPWCGCEPTWREALTVLEHHVAVEHGPFGAVRRGM